jgi:hypothetical protein
MAINDVKEAADSCLYPFPPILSPFLRFSSPLSFPDYLIIRRVFYVRNKTQEYL